MSSYHAASSIYPALLEEQSSQGWMRRMLLGESAAAKFKKLQSKVVEELGLVQAETLLDVASGVQALQSHMNGRTFSADEVGRCRLTISKPLLEAPVVSAACIQRLKLQHD